MTKRMRWLGMIAAVNSICAAHAAPMPGQGTWETTFEGRDVSRHAVAASSASAVFLYDNVLDITWLRDANVKGQMDWATANNWANDLVVGSFSDWRLPTMVDTGAPGCDFSYSGTDCGFNMQTKSGAATYSEMAHLWYVALGNKALFDINGLGPQPGWGLSNTGTFQNMQSDSTRGYWTGLVYATFPNVAWSFGTDDGSQNTSGMDFTLYAMAVRTGDVAAVPEPQTSAMLLAAESKGPWSESKGRGKGAVVEFSSV